MSNAVQCSYFFLLCNIPKIMPVSSACAKCDVIYEYTHPDGLSSTHILKEIRIVPSVIIIVVVIVLVFV